jgi:cobalt/nickel transport system permease protein
MHIPDGFLSAPVWGAMSAVSAGAVGVAVKRSSRALDLERVPLMGVAAAFIFAAQMINFPVMAGVSGHLLGACLAAILLGLWPAILVMTTVFVVQCLMFQDGGITALGANLFNMGVVGAFLGHGLFHALRRVLPGHAAPAFIAAWVSVMAGALATAAQLWASGIAAVVFPAMLGIHALIGIGEGMITVAALGLVLGTRPDLLEEKPARDPGAWVLGAVIVAVGIAALLSPWASAWPDGLERVAEQLGFGARAAGEPAIAAPLPDYAVPALGQSGMSTAAAGVIGTLLVFGAGYGWRYTRTRARARAGARSRAL